MPRWTVIGTLAGSLVCGLGVSWLLLQVPSEERAPEEPAAVVAADARATQDNAPPVFDTSDWGPLPIPAGYSGTADVRTGADTAADTTTVPRALPRWAEGASKDQLPDVAKALAKADDYGIALHRLYQLGDKPAHEDDVLVTRFQREPERMAELLEQALAKATGVARQNIIFHMALALPDEIAFERLRAISRDGDRADAADVLHAMAFRGEPAAVTDFEALAARPDQADCHILCDAPGDHDELARAGKRDILRGYRCIELLDCRPYFHLHAWKYRRGPAATFPWADRKAAETVQQRRELAKRILPSWLARYPGHPGGDDMCYRLAREARNDNAYLEAAQWASLGATVPDQDMRGPCTRLLLSLAELYLLPHELDALLSGRAWERNRQLIQYIRLRRAAVVEGFDAALDMAKNIAIREPDSVLGASFVARWSSDPARGLKSGATPLPDDDPLMLKSGPDVVWQRLVNPAVRDGNQYDEQRLYPRAEAVQLPTDYLAWQFRLWETQAELTRRCRFAHGDELADLEYKIGAVFYHSRWVLFPVYADHLRNSGLPDPRSGSGSWDWSDDQCRRMREFREGASSRAQAARQFERLADEHPHWALRDKALYSAAVARIKLVDDWPFAPTAPLAEYIPEGVRLFERVTAEHPYGSLANCSAAAAGYWRRAHAYAWKQD